MRFRKLRITWSAFWGLGCLLLIVLWVRSYWRWDAIAFEFPKSNGVSIKSFRGKTVTKTTKLPPGQPRPSGIDTLTADNPKVIFFEKYGSSFKGPLVLKYNGDSTDVFYWSPVVLSAILVCIPWLPWARRFSLRTLLIATTLVAVMLGLIVRTAKS